MTTKLTDRDLRSLARTAAKASFRFLKQECRPFRWGLDGLKDNYPEDYKLFLELATDEILKSWKERKH